MKIYNNTNRRMNDIGLSRSMSLWGYMAMTFDSRSMSLYIKRRSD